MVTETKWGERNMFFITLTQISTGEHQIKCCFSSSWEVNNLAKIIAIDQLHVRAIKVFCNKFTDSRVF